jgi:predicted transcriptional regulator
MSRPLKTATLPSLRVEPEFRDKAESVLNEGETLSAFMEEAVRKQVEIRKSQAEFIARGLAAREESKRTGIYYSADEVLAELKSMLDAKLAEDNKQ